MATMEERMVKAEGRLDRIDLDLYGRNGDLGVIREFREGKAEHTGRMKLLSVFGVIGGILSAAAILLSLIKDIQGFMK